MTERSSGSEEDAGVPALRWHRVEFFGLIRRPVGARYDSILHWSRSQYDYDLAQSRLMPRGNTDTVQGEVLGMQSPRR